MGELQNVVKLGVNFGIIFSKLGMDSRLIIIIVSTSTRRPENLLDQKGKRYLGASSRFEDIAEGRRLHFDWDTKPFSWVTNSFHPTLVPKVCSSITALY